MNGGCTGTIFKLTSVLIQVFFDSFTLARVWFLVRVPSRQVASLTHVNVTFPGPRKAAGARSVTSTGVPHSSETTSS